MGTWLNPRLSIKQGIVLPLRLPPRLPLIMTDFGFKSDGDWWNVVSGEWNMKREYRGSGVPGVSVLKTKYLDDFLVNALVNAYSYVDVDVWRDAGILFRYRDESNFYLAYPASAPGDTLLTSLRLGQMVEGTWTLLEAVTISAEWGKWYKLGVRVVGDSCKVYWENAELISLTLPSPYIPSGMVGLRTWHCEGHFDNLILEE